MALFRSIRSKIIVGIVSLLVVLAVALTVVATQHTQDALRREISATHEARAEKVAQDLEEMTDDVLRIAGATARVPSMREPVPEETRGPDGLVPPGNESAKRLLLHSTIAATPLLSGALLVDIDGRAVLGEPAEVQQRAAAQAADPQAPGPYVVVVQTMLNVLEQDPARTTFVQRGATPGAWVVVSPVFALDPTTFQGVLVFEGNNAPLVDFVVASAAGPDRALLIVDDQGIVVAGPPPFDPGTDLRRSVDLLGGDRRGTDIVTLDDREHLASLFPVTGTGWRIVFATDTDTAFAAIDDIVRTTAFLGGAALVFGIIMSLVLAQDLSTPVRRLQAAAQRVTAGEYGTQVRVSTRDELADLAGAFNAMSARLQEEHQRLLRHQEELEETVDERTRELREKNDELEAFVYAASHDLRTPIISLDWLVQELKDQVPAELQDEQLRRTLERMQANIEGMDRLVADLLELSRIGRTEGEPEAVPLEDVVRQVVDELEPRLKEKAATVRVQLDDAPVVLADRRRMHQVFANLVGNALKYGRDQGGTITVRAAPIGMPERPWKWRVEVSDDGPGVPPEHRDRIFHLFQRAPDPLGRVIEGTGVGLAMVKKIVRAYGGDVQVTDAPGGGASFWFTLPAPRARPAPLDAPGPAAGDVAPIGAPSAAAAPEFALPSLRTAPPHEGV